MKTRTKIIVTLLSLALLVSAVLGITAFAADNETVKPEIFAYNVSHENSYKLMFAVKKDTVLGDNLKMVVKDADGNLLDEQSFDDKAAAPEVTVGGVDCYKLTSRAGIAPADIAMQLYVTVSTTVDGTEIAADTVRYSLAEYCYQRLILDGLLWTEDENDLKRAELYLNTIALGASAQDVLRNLNSDATDDIGTLVTEMIYVAHPYGTVDGDYWSGVYEEAPTFTLGEYSGNIPAGYSFVGWNVMSVENGTDRINEVVPVGASITPTAHTVVTPALKAVVTFDDFDADAAEYDKNILSNPASNITLGFTSGYEPAVDTAADKYTGFDANVVDAIGKAAGDKALLIKSTTAQASKSALDLAVPVLAGEEGSCYTFSTDIYWQKASTETKGTYIQLNFKSGESYSYRLTLSGAQTNNVYGLELFSSNSKGEDRYSILTGCLTSEEWYNVTVKLYYHDGVYSSKIFINGMYICDDNSYNSTSSSPIEQVSVNFYDNYGTAYLDNISFVRSDEAFAQGAPVGGLSYPTAIGADKNGNGTFFADAEKNGNRYDYDSFPENQNHQNAAVNIYDGATRADAFRTEDDYIYFGKNSEYNVGHSNIRYNTTAASGDVAFKVVEFDAAFGNLDNNRTLFLIKSYGNGYGVDVYLAAEDGKIVFRNVRSGYTSPALSADTWYNIRLEIYTDSENYDATKKQALVKVYIDGVLACEVNGVDAVASGNEYTLLRLHQYATNEYVLYDNLYLGYEAKAAAAE